MPSLRQAKRTLHELAKWSIVLGLALVVAWGGLLTAEQAASRKHGVLVERAQRYRQTEYAERYASHARAAETRVKHLQTLQRRWGDPVPGTALLVLGGVLFGLTRPRRSSRTIVIDDTPPTVPDPPAALPSRPGEADPRTSRSETPHTPLQTLFGPGSG